VPGPDADVARMIRGWLDGVRQDVTFGLRSFRRRPALTAVAIATLALGIGGTTAIYSVVDAVLLDAPPYRDPDRLVTVWHRFAALGGERTRIPGPDAAEYARLTGSFEASAFVRGADDLALEGETERHVRVGVASDGLFDLLGVDMAEGRRFRPGEGIVSAGGGAGATPPGPLVLGHDLWLREFGADPDVIGRIVRLSGRSLEVVGVLPAGFALRLPPGAGVPDEIDAWTTLPAPLDAFRRPEGLRDQDSDNTGVFLARLAPGATIEGARRELAVLAARQGEAVPAYAEAGLRVEVEGLHEGLVAGARPIVLALFGAVVFVLFIACINVANLLLARGTERRPEMAVRTALGAGRGRLVRQLVTESAILAGTGAALGTLLAIWGGDALLALAPDGLEGFRGARLDTGVLLTAALASAGAALLFGLAPAALVARGDGGVLRAAGARGGGGRTRPIRRILVVAEVALSFALLVGAGITLRSAVNLGAVDPGFDPEGLHTFAVTLPGGTVGGPGARAALMDRFEREIRALPEVEAVGLIGGLPLGGTVFRQPFGPGGSAPEEWARDEANFRVVTAEYFTAMRTRLLAGRTFSPSENLDESERVAIVSPALAERLAPDGNAVGLRIGFPLDGDPVYATVVGVVDDVRFDDLRRPGGRTIYVPYRQEASRTVSVAVRASGPAPGLYESVRSIAAGLSTDTSIPVYDFRDMDAYVARAFAPTRFAMTLVALFATVALLLASVGLAGVISYSVGRRTREFGIRIALGADPRHVLARVLRGGLGLVAMGLVAGAAIALGTSAALGAIAFEVAPVDPPSYALSALTLLVAALLAGWIPARRAAAVEPLEALRVD